MTQATPEQLAICHRFSVNAEPPNPNEKLGIALGTLDKLPLNAIRHLAVKGTCGWYIWGGEYSNADDFYEPMHVFHLPDYCPQILPYLALPPGWGVIIDPVYEDVWFDQGFLIE